MPQPALAVKGLTVRLPGHALPILTGADLELGPGEIVGLCGRSGSGKSTLLHAVAGLLPWSRPADVSGAIELGGESIADLDPGQRAHLLATCLDRPDAQLFLSTARHELATAARLHGRTPFGELVAETLALGPLLDHRVTGLSSGERQRLALAVSLAAAPRPVLLDEPTVHLDEAGAHALAQALRAIRALGGSVLVAEQAGWRLGDAVDRWLELEDGTLRDRAAPTPPQLERPLGPPGPPLLEVSNLRLRRGERTLLEGVNLSFGAGEIVLLSGPNGAGKSSLARALAGHAAAAGGGLSVVAGELRRPRGTALLLPEANVQLFADTAADELTFGGTDPLAVAVVLSRHRLEHLSGRAPWTLSQGERLRLAHAALDVLRPQMLIVDEPGQGLDPLDFAELARLIGGRAAEGRSYLIVSHRRELALLAHRHFAIVGETLVDAGAGR
jgi:energy-coupling factor transporter ATP-binding protein EcfA2